MKVTQQKTQGTDLWTSMKIKEITEYVTDYVHGDVDKVIKRLAKKKMRMGYHPMMAYPYRVEGWSKKYKKSINCNNPKGFSQKAHCAGKKKNEEAAGVGIVTKQNATKDVPVGGQYMNVKKLKLDWKEFNENFADGKKKGKSRPGRVKRSGASCNGSVTSLRSKAKKASGERAKMYHWCANMKSGRKKSK